jgi:Tfp pilus assembly protein FimT
MLVTATRTSSSLNTLQEQMIMARNVAVQRRRDASIMRTDLDMRRILGLSPQAGSNRVGTNTISLPENDFGLLVAIGPVLRQSSGALVPHSNRMIFRWVQPDNQDGRAVAAGQ